VGDNRGIMKKARRRRRRRRLKQNWQRAWADDLRDAKALVYLRNAARRFWQSDPSSAIVLEPWGGERAVAKYAANHYGWPCSQPVAVSSAH
jgi:hypothetical protein